MLFTIYSFLALIGTVSALTYKREVSSSKVVTELHTAWLLLNYNVRGFS